MRGASALDELLDRHPEARLRAQVVWEPVLKTDLVAPLGGVLSQIDDRRVVQYWDPDRVLSKDLVRSVNVNPAAYGLEEAFPPDFIVWDAVLVFGASDVWESELPRPAYHGGPVVKVIEEAERALREELQR